MAEFDEYDEVLDEIKEHRRDKSYLKVINKKRLSKYELDELMNNN